MSTEDLFQKIRESVHRAEPEATRKQWTDELMGLPLPEQRHNLLKEMLGMEGLIRAYGRIGWIDSAECHRCQHRLSEIESKLDKRDRLGSRRRDRIIILIAGLTFLFGVYELLRHLKLLPLWLGG